MVSKNEYLWTEIMPTIDAIENLVILQTLQKNGLPQMAEERVALLKRLRTIQAGDYPVTYEGLCDFSVAFASSYPKEAVIGLIQQVITGAQPYQMEINHARISEEDKALLLFVLPMPKSFTDSVDTEVIE